MMRRSIPLLTALVLFPAALHAADPATQPALENDDTTPIGMLRSQTQAIADGGVTVARDRIHVADKRYNDLADTLAQLSVLSARLELAVAAKWGNETSAELAHAFGTMASADADNAAATLTDADHATIHWKNLKAASYLIRVDGHWKRDLDKSCASMDEHTFALSQDFYKALVPQLDELSKELAADKYPVADDFITHTRLVVTKTTIAIARKENQPAK